MPITNQIAVQDLSLDLKNYRTTPQISEVDAIKAMLRIKPDRFAAVLESLIDTGYLATENVIVLREKNSLTVKEGNRRIASLKLIHGMYDLNDFDLPTDVKERIRNLGTAWKLANDSVPCAIYDIAESDTVDRIVTLAHGKGEKAGRDPWTSVARARHNRDVNNSPEPALDLLEKYLEHGTNLNGQQIERWSGDYPVTVLDEAIKKVHSRFNVATSVALAKDYPKIIKKDELDNIMLAIGLEQIKYKTIRSRTDFATPYGIPPHPSTAATPIVPPSSGSANPPTTPAAAGTPQPANSVQPSNPAQATTTPQTGPPIPSPSTNGAQASTTSPQISAAYATNDPRQVAKRLNGFIPQGNNRAKVVDLKNELLQLKLRKNPIAFCFLLRSMFEISAKVYCDDHSLPTTIIRNGHTSDKNLAALLTDIKNHLTGNGANKNREKALHGAITELNKASGLLSVTSMNQLVHNPSFSISPSDICLLFGNVYPLLEAMN